MNKDEINTLINYLWAAGNAGDTDITLTADEIQTIVEALESYNGLIYETP